MTLAFQEHISASVPEFALQAPLNDQGLLRSECFVGGQWTGIAADDVEDPATGRVVGQVPRFGARETTTAVEIAHRALADWARRTAKERSGLLRAWFSLIFESREDLACILTSEQGKPLVEARGEIEYAASFVEFYAEEAKRVYGEVIPSPVPDSRIIVSKHPIGVVAAITPWNFPAAMITRKIAPALAAGCTVVVKPAPETPLTALALAVLAERAGIPPGVLNVITGEASEIGKVLTEHPAVRFVGFTGSTAIGKLLMRQASSSVKKVGLELGGNAPFIVFDDADIDAAVDGAMISKFRNMGQTCVCTNRFYVQDSVHDAFVGKLTARVAALTVGNGFEEGVMQGPLINAAALGKVERHVEDARVKGARVCTGGHRHALGGTYYTPTVLIDVTEEMDVSREETFGPLAAVSRFSSEGDAIAAANGTSSGLAAYVYTRDASRTFRLIDRLEFGMIGINTGAISTEVAPFGGVKESGLGREGSRHGIEEYLELRYSMIAGLQG
jgi:succinate-semialdehyde dehydrogenase / glutarate-semialdehyde dehydrogenase